MKEEAVVEKTTPGKNTDKLAAAESVIVAILNEGLPNMDVIEEKPKEEEARRMRAR